MGLNANVLLIDQSGDESVCLIDLHEWGECECLIDLPEWGECVCLTDLPERG